MDLLLSSLCSSLDAIWFISLQSRRCTVTSALPTGRMELTASDFPMVQSTMRSAFHRPIRFIPEQTPLNLCVLGLPSSACLDECVLETLEQYSWSPVSGSSLESDTPDITTINKTSTAGDSYNTQLAVGALVFSSTSVDRTITCHATSPHAGQQQERLPVDIEEQQVDNVSLELISNRQHRSLLTLDARKTIGVSQHHTKSQYGYRQQVYKM